MSEQNANVLAKSCLLDGQVTGLSSSKALPVCHVHRECQVECCVPEYCLFWSPAIASVIEMPVVQLCVPGAHREAEQFHIRQVCR
jgi:hypothetical protein